MLYTDLSNFSPLFSWLHAGTYIDLCVNQNTQSTYCGDYEFTELQLHPHYDSTALYLRNN